MRGGAKLQAPMVYDWGLRYSRCGEVSHLVRSDLRIALCGLVPDPLGGGWFGTGSQDEYERAEKLLKCRRCVGVWLKQRGLDPGWGEMVRGWDLKMINSYRRGTDPNEHNLTRERAAR